MSAFPHGTRRPREAGFTLIEVMIAVAVTALLLTIALPSFMDSMRKGRRSDGVAALTAVQQAQERWRSSHPGYTSSLTDLQLPANSSRGYYTVSVAADTDPTIGYTATAAAGGSQASDTACAFMAVRIIRGEITYGSGSSSSVSFPDPNRCWAR